MSRIQIIPFPPDSPEICAAARRFNERLVAAGNGQYQFSESHSARAFPKLPERSTWMEYFLALDEGPEVRGGYILRPQPWWSRGERLELTFLKLPVSEGVFDPAYSALGIGLLQDAEQRVPSIYALGMGGIQNKLPRILMRLGWEVLAVPFYFRVCRASRVLTQIAPMRSTSTRRWLCDIAAYTGLGALAFAVKQGLSIGRRRAGKLSVTLEKSFGHWCDELWHQCHAAYDWVGLRDTATLDILYPPTDARFLRLLVRREGKVIGWALALCTDMRSHKQFGNLRVASIVDGMCLPIDAADVILAATQWIESMKPDLIVSNQLHAAWVQGMKRSGFLSGPSNYALALSPGAINGLRERGCTLEAMMINRGDGDGPINL